MTTKQQLSSRNFWCIICLICFIPILVASDIGAANTATTVFNPHPDVLDVKPVEWNQTYSGLIVSGERKIYQFITDVNVSLWIRVWISSNISSKNEPIYVTAKTAKTIRSWTIPDEYDSISYQSVSRVLCNRDGSLELEFVSSSTTLHNYTFFVEPLEPTYFSIGKSINSVVSDVSYPMFHFAFPPNVYSVIMRTISDDSICAMIRVEQESCKEDHFASESKLQIIQNFLKYGTVTIDRADFEHCQITVLLRHPNFCEGRQREGFELVEDTNNDGAVFLNQTKRFKIVVELWKPSFPWPIVWFFLLVTIPAITVLIICKLPVALRYLHQPIDIDQLSLPFPIVKSNEMLMKALANATNRGKIVLFPSRNTSPVLAAQDAKKCDKGRHVNVALYDTPDAVSGSFLYNLLIVATFYSLPAVQLLFQQMWFAARSGNQDMCYYNFRCAVPIGPFSAFNNVFSNYGYICLGIVFLIIVRVHSNYLVWRYKEVFYALGVAMILEGFLSASYHLCPNSQSFQFDTTFMYALAGLMLYHLYQIRNPRPRDHPYKLFAVYAAAIFFVVMSAIVAQQAQPWKIVLAILYGIASIGITILVIRTIFMFNELAVHHVTVSRVMIVLQYALNVGFLCVGLWAWIESPESFSSILLFVFLGNLFLFTTFYFILKVLQKERLVLAPILSASLSIILWSVSLYFYNYSVSNWQMTPAISRDMNKDCVLWEFYDHHDVWHLLSSMGIFTSLLFILTLDDGRTLAQLCCLACHSTQTSLRNVNSASSSFHDAPDGSAQDIPDGPVRDAADTLLPPATDQLDQSAVIVTH